MAQHWKVGTSWHAKKQQPMPLAGGYAIPSGFTVTAERGALHVELQVVVDDGRARTTRVTVETDAAAGVTSTTLRQVPIRDLVASGVKKLLFRVVLEASDDEAGNTTTAATVAPVRSWGEAEVAATKQLVGYIDGGKR